MRPPGGDPITLASDIWSSPQIGDVGLRILDEWRVIDRWWTQFPTDRSYRIVIRDGVQRVEMRRGDEDWSAPPEIQH